MKSNDLVLFLEVIDSLPEGFIFEKTSMGWNIIDPEKYLKDDSNFYGAMLKALEHMGEKYSSLPTNPKARKLKESKE